MYLFLSLGISAFFSIASAHPAYHARDTHTQVNKESQTIPGTSIEYYKNDICETTPGVDSFSGYVHLSSSAAPDLQGATPFNISTFFWYFSARNNPETAPLSIYFAGGPGESSTYTAMTENGPCYANKDGNSTTINPYSFNNHVNMLYIDQPNMVGFSYDEVVEGYFDVLDGNVYPIPGVEANQTIIPGHFPSQNPNNTANTTEFAARATWYFMQTWLTEFEEYHGPKDTVSVWGNSYGGYWTTGTVHYFLDQNVKLANGTIDCSKYQIIHIDTLGITNGCIDLEIQAPSYVSYPYNNTYGVQIYNETVYDLVSESLNKEGGCLDLIKQCRAAQSASDPGSIAVSEEANALCANATAECFANVLGPFYTFGHNEFDIASPSANPFPPLDAQTFLNQVWVKEALGVPGGLNLTLNSGVVVDNFFKTGDLVRRKIDDVNAILESGIKVAMVYGDRDWKCSWIGAEAISLRADYASVSAFRASGYTPIISSYQSNSTNATGVVRQHESFSFSRVFDAGHAVSFYQPETVLSIFERAMFGKDVATGTQETKKGSGYSTKGPASAWGWKNDISNAGPYPNLCSVWSSPSSCSEAQQQALKEGKAVIENYNVIEPSS